jgi:hypothetical protein
MRIEERELEAGGRTDASSKAKARRSGAFSWPLKRRALMSSRPRLGEPVELPDLGWR